MEGSGLTLTHVRPLAVAGSWAGRRIVFVHIPKTAGTTFDWIVDAVAQLRGETRIRALGTVYGQFLGPGKPEAADSLAAMDPAALAAARYLGGHITAQRLCDACADPGAVLVALLRDPVARMLSHYRFGIERGGWPGGTPLCDVVQGGGLVDNLQTRMLAGCENPRERCDEAMVARALARLRGQPALIGASEGFDRFLGTAIGLFGWPQVMYSRMQVGQLSLLPTETIRFARDAEALNRFDRMLFDELGLGGGGVWINGLRPGPAPASDAAIVVASPAIRGAANDAVHMTQAGLDRFTATMRAQGVAVVNAEAPRAA